MFYIFKTYGEKKTLLRPNQVGGVVIGCREGTYIVASAKKVHILERYAYSRDPVFPPAFRDGVHLYYDPQL